MDLSEAEDTLGVTRQASESQIKRAFRKQAQNHHPDQSDDPDAVTNFQRLEKAKRRLLDETSESNRRQRTTRSPDSQTHTSSTESSTRSSTSSTDTSSDRSHHRTRGKTNQTERGQSSINDQVQRVYSDVWTGRDFWELATVIRHYSTPYLDTFTYRFEQGWPALVSVFLGFIGLIAYGSVVPGAVAVALTAATQLIVTSKSTSRGKHTLSGGYYHFDIPRSRLLRTTVPVFGCAGCFYFLSRFYGSPVGAIGSTIAILLMWMFMTGLLAGLGYIVVSVLYEPTGLGIITSISGTLSLIAGFTTWLGPVVFVIDPKYLIFQPSLIAGVNVGLLLNVVVTLTLTYVTIGMFFNSSGVLVDIVHRDHENHIRTCTPIWFAAPGLIVTAVFGLGGTVTPYVSEALLGAIALSAPAISFLAYCGRRELEPRRQYAKEAENGNSI
jgi:predicted membrane protein